MVSHGWIMKFHQVNWEMDWKAGIGHVCNWMTEQKLKLIGSGKWMAIAILGLQSIGSIEMERRKSVYSDDFLWEEKDHMDQSENWFESILPQFKSSLIIPTWEKRHILFVHYLILRNLPVIGQIMLIGKVHVRYLI